MVITVAPDTAVMTTGRPDLIPIKEALAMTTTMNTAAAHITDQDHMVSDQDVMLLLSIILTALDISAIPLMVMAVIHTSQDTDQHTVGQGNANASTTSGTSVARLNARRR